MKAESTAAYFLFDVENGLLQRFSSKRAINYPAPNPPCSTRGPNRSLSIRTASPTGTGLLFAFVKKWLGRISLPSLLYQLALLFKPRWLPN